LKVVFFIVINFSKLLLIGLLGGVIGGYFSNAIYKKETASISSAAVPTPFISIASSDIWQNIVSKISSNFVGIQTFDRNKLLRQGSGIIVSSDGLVATTIDLAGPKGSVYQIFYNDKILQASIVAIDTGSNLILLKTSSLSPNIADLDTSEDHSGAELVLIGNVFELSKLTVASQKATVAYATERSVVLSTSPNSYLYGFGAVTVDGKIKGLVYTRNGKVNLIPSGIVENFFKEYIKKVTK
jgi:S1-C subfamily serine protease